jgi:hypothetical protein
MLFPYLPLEFSPISKRWLACFIEKNRFKGANSRSASQEISRHSWETNICCLVHRARHWTGLQWLEGESPKHWAKNKQMRRHLLIETMECWWTWTLHALSSFNPPSSPCCGGRCVSLGVEMSHKLYLGFSSVIPIVWSNIAIGGSPMMLSGSTHSYSIQCVRRGKPLLCRSRDICFLPAAKTACQHRKNRVVPV